MTETRTRMLPNLTTMAVLLATVGAQQVPTAPHGFGTATWLVVPQSRSIALHPSAASAIAVTAVHARVGIVGRTVHTELDLVLHNAAVRSQEAVVLMPVPRGAVVSSFDFAGNAAEPTARVMPEAEARSVYDAIVRKLRDPALLEYAGLDLIRSSVFPVAAGGTQRIRIGYDNLLEQDGARVDFELPRSESIEQATPWTITVSLRSTLPIGMVFSPSHAIVTKRDAPNRFTVELAAESTRAPGPFRLSYLLGETERVTASLFAYPDPAEGGGYFLLMAGVPRVDAEVKARVTREVSIVLDRSGSMAGGKLDQARAAALQVIEGLADGEAFQVIDYASDVARFAAAPVVKSSDSIRDVRGYLAALRPGGGTNIHDALVEALRPDARPDSLPIVLFLTDGLPTVGATDEIAIRGVVERGNPMHRRIFTFGVGNDVNVPLLDRIADLSRATATYVQPGEDVELRVGQVYRELYGPVLTDIELETVAASGELDTRRVRDQEPGRLPDLFDDDQMIVLGRYRGDAPLAFRMSGKLFGEPRDFAFRFGLEKASTRNAFVPRLWASRRIAALVDQVRQAGASNNTPRAAAHDPFADPRLRELRDEIVRLSTQFGILTEYTAFLATEGTALGNWGALTIACGQALDNRAIQTRSGLAAFSQNVNIEAQRRQIALNYRNAFVDSALNRVEISNVQQVCDRAFFRRGNRWVDGRLVPAGVFEPDRIVRRGSPEHDALLETLTRQGRNGVLSLRGEILLRVGTETILVTADGC